ncbi:MAG: hypothetical protein WD716_07695 [Fimbriimonadaceae bacterium]
MLTALLVGLLGPQPQTVTFSHPCAHSSVVLEALGKELGVKMGPGGSVLQDYFAVKFTDRPVEDVKRVIAETLNAVWVQRGEYLVLDRGPVQHRKEQEQDSELLRAEINKYLEVNPAREFDKAAFKVKAIELVAASSNAQQASRAETDLRKLSPDALLAPKVIRSLGPDALLAIRDGEPVTYEFKGNGETNMPPALLRTLQRYFEDCDAADELARNVGVSWGAYVRRPALGDKTTLRASRQEGMVRVVINSMSNGPQGTPMSFIHHLKTFAGAELPRVKFEGLTQRLKIEDPAKSLLNVAWSNRNVYGEVAEPAPKEQQSLALNLAQDLVSNEVLDIVGMLPLKAVAEAKKRDYVALIDDNQAENAPWMGLVETATLQAVWESWGQGLSITEDTETKILKVFPNKSRNVREARFDRAEASRFVSSFVANRRVTIDALAGLAVASDSERSFGHNVFAGRLFLPVTHFQGSNWEALRVYGSINGGQKRQAETDGAVFEWRNLPRKAQEAITHRLSRNFQIFAVRPPSSVVWHTFAITYTSPASENRERVASIPPDTQVRVYCWKTRAMHPKTHPSGNFSLLTVDQYARFKALGLRSMGDENVHPPDYSQLGIVDAEWVQVEVFVPGRGYTALAAHATSITNDTPFFTSDKLPEPWKSQLAEAIKKAGGGTQ